MNTKYDDQLREIEVFRVHPSLLPFVGDSYETYRVLHIGESHYINQNSENEQYGIEFFNEHWWNNSCQEAIEKLDCKNWIDTRKVLDRYICGEKGSYTIFTNFIKSFSRVVLKKEIGSISLETKGLYKYISFMNFFQMPSLYEGQKYWNSLLKSSKKANNKALVYDLWETSVEKSGKTVDAVIDIINPKAVVFTSISAGEAYRNYKKMKNEQYDDNKFIFTSHPNTPYTWNKCLKSLGGKKGIEVFESRLKDIYG